MQQPDMAWARSYQWGKADLFELKVVDKALPTTMLLPLWGWEVATYCYRLTYAPIDADTIDLITYDIFQNEKGRVLVVCGFEGRDEFEQGDFNHSQGGSAWEAPARAVEPPQHLVDEGGRRDIEDWIFDGIVAPELRWTQMTEMNVENRLDGATAVDFKELPAAVRIQAAECLENQRWSWQQRNIEIDDVPRLAAHFSAPPQCEGADRWGVAYQARAAAERFWFLLNFSPGPNRGVLAECRVAFRDEIDADGAGDQDQALLAALCRRAHDPYSATLDSDIPF